MTTIVASTSGRGYNVLVDGKVVGFVTRGRRQRDPSRRVRPAKGWLWWWRFTCTFALGHDNKLNGKEIH